MENGSFFTIDRPLELAPAKGRCRAATLSGLAKLLRELGQDPRAILERHDLLAVTDPEAHLGCRQIAAALEDCAIGLDDPVFGARLAARQVPEVFGSIAAMARAAPTVRAALNCFADYMPVVHAADSEVLLLDGKDTAELCWQVHTDVGINDQAHYQAAMLNVRVLQAIGGEYLRPSYVSLSASPRPRDVLALEHALGCKVFTRQARNVVAFPSHALQNRVRTANRLIYRLLGDYLNRARSASHLSITEQIETYIESSMSSGRCSVEACAASLGIGVRTLQAQLSAKGLGFSELLAQVRYERAKRLLAQRELSLDEIAYRLGYAEQTAFGRFFKRKAGKTPQVYRNWQAAA